MKTRAASAAAGGGGAATTTPGGGQPTRGGGGGGGAKAPRDRIRDSTNNHPQQPAPPPIIKSNQQFKKKKKQKKKKGKKSSSTTSTSTDSLLSHSAAATSYLHRWENNRSEWRFEKLKQVWLLQNALDRDLISDEYFEILLNYLTLIKGAAKTTTLAEMRRQLAEYEGRYSAGQGGQPSDEENSRYERARLIVQMLSEDEGEEG